MKEKSPNGKSPLTNLKQEITAENKPIKQTPSSKLELVCLSVEGKLTHLEIKVLILKYKK